jgi:putative addiction module killer protein
MIITVIIYADGVGNEPFTKWLYRLRDNVARRRILARLRRLEQGHRGDCKRIEDGVHELRLLFGPGYRIYYGEVGDKLIILLCGGDKSSQQDDI